MVTKIAQQVDMGAVMDESFALVLSTWAMSKLVAFLAKQRYSHIIIRRLEGSARYHYLFPKKQVQAVVTKSLPDMTVHQAFDLHEPDATPEVQVDDQVATTQLARAIVMDRGRVAGFVDDSVLPRPEYNIVRAPSRAAAEPPRAGTVAQPFKAFPALTAPDTVTPGDSFDIYVGFRDQPDPKVDGSDPIQIESPDPDSQCLVVLSSDGVTLDADHEYIPLKLNASVRFSGKLKPGVTQASVKALFIYKEQVIASARREILAVGAVTETTPPIAARVTNPCRVQTPTADSAVDITISLDSKRDGTLEWRLIAAAYPQQTEIIKLETYLPDTKQFAADLMRDLKARAFRGTIARNVLETMGQDIATYMPPEFFDVLQTVHANLERPPTLLLLTNETYVPWELAYLANPLDPSAPPFLGAQTIMGRWLEDPRVMLPPTMSLKVARMTAVASEYGLASGQRQLLEAVAEQKSLCDQWRAVPLQATSEEMETMVTGAKIPGHLVHFAVHGYSDPAANNQALLLVDKTQLPATAMTGAYTCGATPRFSFVFLNACQVGTPGRSLGHAGGFPGVLVRGGTVGFIAPLWDVHDDVARATAESFYQETFASGRSVGEALLTRRKAYDNDSTTPLAYIYYGHPGLRLSRAN